MSLDSRCLGLLRLSFTYLYAESRKNLLCLAKKLLLPAINRHFSKKQNGSIKKVVITAYRPAEGPTIVVPPRELVGWSDTLRPARVAYRATNEIYSGRETEMVMKRTVLSICVASLLLVSTKSSLAGLIETSSTRFVITDANGGTIHNGPEQINGPSPYGPFSPVSEMFAIEGDNGGTTYAYQISDVSPGHYSGECGAYASAFGDGSDFADAYAQCYYEVKFTLTTPETYNITGLGGAFGEINGETSITTIKINSLGGGSPTVLIMQSTHDYANFAASGTLLPGNYSFTIDSVAIVDRTFVNGFGDANAGVPNFDMTITPEPSSLTILSLGAFTLLRRRR